jgi:hypothetical protein
MPDPTEPTTPAPDRRPAPAERDEAPPEKARRPVPGVRHEPEPDGRNVVPAEDGPGTL